MNSDILKSLTTIESNLVRAAERGNEFAERLTALEQRDGNAGEREMRAFEASQHKARSLSGDADGYGIVKIHNRGELLHIVGSKARVADVLPKQKASAVSLGRYLAAGLLGQKCGDRDALEAVAETKAVSTGTSGLVIPAEYQGEWIDRLRANMVLVKAGAQTVPMANKTLTAAALTADPTAAWHTEATADITSSDPTFAARTLTAQTVAVRCTASVEATQDSPNFGDQLAAAMAAAIAVEIDRVGLVGSGTPPEPRGILNVVGINTVASGGTLASYAKLTESVQELLEANVPLEVAAKLAIMSPRTWGRFEGLATGITSDLSPLPRPRSLENTQFLVTTAVPNTISTDKSVLFMGDFRDLLMGVRTDTTIEAVKLTTYASSLLIEFIAYSRVDFLATRPASFVTLTGIA